MKSMLHQEFEVRVVSVRPWGLEVTFHDGTLGMIDNTKDPDWPTGDREAVIGKVIQAVVLDDERIPVRLSALDADREVARAKRSSAAE